MTTPDFRALCAEFVAQVERLTRTPNPPDMGGWLLLSVDVEDLIALADRARAALAQEQQWPTDEELLELMPESMRDEFFYAASQCSALLGGRIKPDVFRMALDTAALEYARAVLARWGGAAPQPVPVTERLPGPEDCDEQGRCWWWRSDGVDEHWELVCIRNPIAYKTACADHVSYDFWLPANALPLPEVEHD